MRLWTLHLQYLDQKGLSALWREGLGALKALKAYNNGEKCGYQNHPQLNRFKEYKDGYDLLTCYLLFVCEEARERGYNFDSSKIDNDKRVFGGKITVTTGQVEYEANLLMDKMMNRKSPLSEADHMRYNILYDDACIGEIQVHPIFNVIEGKIEEWEKVK